MRTWEAHLDSKALEIDKLALSDPTLRCIYDWNIAEVNDECSKNLFGSTDSLARALSYIDHILFFLEEIAQYSYEYDPRYVVWYREWVEALKQDSSGLVSFAKYKYFIEDDGCGRGYCEDNKNNLICSTLCKPDQPAVCPADGNFDFLQEKGFSVTRPP